MYKVIQGYKGREIVATKDIKKGTIILKEYPSLICEDLYDAIYIIYENYENKTKLQKEFEKMAPYKIDKYMITEEEIRTEIAKMPEHRANFFNNFDIREIRVLAAKFYRNAFNYSVEFGGPSAILFEGNLFNHSCDPNVDFYIDKNGFFIFTTNRDIYASEELTDKYIDVNLSSKKRQKLLLEQYGFFCTCTKCIH